MTAVVRALSFVVLETVTVPLGLTDRLRAAAVEMTPDDSRCAHCGEGVGVVIYGDADEHQRWMTTVVVDNGQRTWLLCEDCGVPLDPSPDGIPIDAASAVSISECTCVTSCAEDPATACSLSGQPHVHPMTKLGLFGPCPAHPEAPGDL